MGDQVLVFRVSVSGMTWHGDQVKQVSRLSWYESPTCDEVRAGVDAAIAEACRDLGIRDPIVHVDDVTYWHRRADEMA